MGVYVCFECVCCVYVCIACVCMCVSACVYVFCMCVLCVCVSLHVCVSICAQVVVTVPLAVLRSGDIQFHPPLPARKMDALKRLGVGVIEKVTTRISTESSVVCKNCSL